MSNSAKQPLRVFLCHAKADKTTVRALYKQLIADGIDAWLDEEKLLPGQNWQVEIPKAVRNSDVVIVCISKESINKEGYVQREIKTALDVAEEKLDSTIFIIPARLENCDVPDRLSIYQWVDLFSRGGYEKLLAALSTRAEQSKAVLPNHRSSNLLHRVYTKPPSRNAKTSNLQIMRFSIVLLVIFIFALSLWGARKLIQSLTPVTPPTPTPTPIPFQVINSDNAGKLVEVAHFSFSELEPLPGLDSKSFDVDWSPDGNEIAVLPWGYTRIYFFDKTLAIYKQVDISFEGTSIQYSPQNDILGVGGQYNGKAYLIRKDGSILSSLDAVNDQPDVFFSNDGSIAITGGYGSEIRFWQVSNGALIKSLNVLGGDTEGALQVKFSLNGDFFATTNRNGQVRLWGTSGNLIHAFDKVYVQDAEFNPTDTTLAVAYVDGTVGLWDVSTGNLIEFINGGMEEVYNISWSPNGEVLAWCGLNGQITLWDIKQRKILVKVGNSEWNIGLEFSPDGRFLLSSGKDNVQLWGIPSP